MGCHFLLQRIFLTQRLNPCLLHWQAASLSLSHQGCQLQRFWLEVSCLRLRENHIKPLFELEGAQRLVLYKRKRGPHSRKWKGKEQTYYHSPRCWDLCVMPMKCYGRWQDLGRERHVHALQPGTDPGAQPWWQPLNKWWSWGPWDRF